MMCHLGVNGNKEYNLNILLVSYGFIQACSFSHPFELHQFVSKYAQTYFDLHFFHGKVINLVSGVNLIQNHKKTRCH